MNHMLTSEDHQKIKDLRLTVFAAKFFELTNDESNDRLLPEEVFMNAVDHTLGIRQSQKTSKLIKQAQFPLPSANIAELHYLPGRNIDQARMKRYANHEWRTDPTNLLIISPTGGERLISLERLELPPAIAGTRFTTHAWMTWHAC